MESTLCVQVGRRIRLLRRRREWTQADLADHSGVGKTHISNIETGKSEICLLTLERIANAFSVTPADLLK